MLRRNVLIVHAGALGDFVLSFPLALALGRLYPQSRIIYVTAAQKGALAERALRVESSDIEGGWHHLYSKSTSIPGSVIKLITGAHIIVSYVSNGEDQWAANIRAINPEARLVSLHTRPNDDFEKHASDYLLEQLQANPAMHEGTAQLLKSINSRGIATLLPANDAIVIHPGSGAREKCWPVDCYAKLIERLKKEFKRIHVLLGEVERERFSASDIATLSSIAQLQQPKTYVSLYDQILQGAVFIGNDSGPGHLAGMAGVPTLSLFGPSRPEVWKPLGPRVKYLQKRPIVDLDVEAVQSKVFEMIRS